MVRVTGLYPAGFGFKSQPEYFLFCSKEQNLKNNNSITINKEMIKYLLSMISFLLSMGFMAGTGYMEIQELKDQLDIPHNKHDNKTNLTFA